MGWRDLFGKRAESTEDLIAQAESARPSSDPTAQIPRLVAEGEKIEAIKLYREHYGTSLADAKEAIDAMARGESPANQPEPLAPASGSEDEVRALVAKGELIDAIKLYRELHGVGLKEAKDAVDAMRG
ncbi:hypothetical protein [Demequina sp.]|uniref:hypothetical protein n=1 Tax=Demequina sp. TaxID=2050685 RepID=UPI003D0C2067